MSQITGDDGLAELLAHPVMETAICHADAPIRRVRGTRVGDSGATCRCFHSIGIVAHLAMSFTRSDGRGSGRQLSST